MTATLIIAALLAAHALAMRATSGTPRAGEWWDE